MLFEKYLLLRDVRCLCYRISLVTSDNHTAVTSDNHTAWIKSKLFSYQALNNNHNGLRLKVWALTENLWQEV